MAATPATDWRETIDLDEAERHQRQADELEVLQARRTPKYGAGRALHRKGVLGLAARLQVRDGLPDHARHGLFAKPAGYDAWVRLSNGDPTPHKDCRPDIRGFAVRVNGVSGDGALGGPATHQDFLLINQTNFHFKTSREFMGLVVAAAKGPLSIIGWAYRTHSWRGMFAELGYLKRELQKRFDGFAGTTFNSVRPVACGPYAVRVRARPQQPVAHSGGEWGAAMAKTVAAGPVAYTVELQFFVDEQRTPIEDASVDWPEDVAPWVAVADLTIAQQDTGSAAGKELAARLEKTVFDPWQALAVHRPLGEVMRARKVAYFTSQTERHAEP